MDIRLRPEWDVGPPGGPRIDASALLVLLAGVQDGGSLADAARSAGQSYRHAWGLVKRAEALFGAPLIESGRGRGSALTDLARK
ncbi:MAG: LysR family transcriptional regulator, partial [Piscinibacter sp.]